MTQHFLKCQSCIFLGCPKALQIICHQFEVAPIPSLSMQHLIRGAMSLLHFSWIAFWLSTVVNTFQVTAMVSFFDVNATPDPRRATIYAC